MNLAKVSTNGQITIPVEIRRLLGLKSGDKMLFFQNAQGEIVVDNASREALRKAQAAFAGAAKDMGITGFSIENVTQVQDNNGECHQIDSDKDPTVILLHYPSIIEDTASYITPRVKIEISCLSMDEPTQECEIRSMIGESFEGEDSDANSKIRTVVPTRTFLEKLFLLAEEFQKDNPRSMRMSRHLYDLEKLMDTQYGREALAYRSLYNAIVEHRRTYYALKYVNYDLHAPATIDFMIPERAMEAWRADYAEMRRFFIYGQSLEFDALIERIKELQERVRKCT